MEQDLRDAILSGITEDVPEGFWIHLLRRHAVIYDEVEEGLKEPAHYTACERFYRRGHDIRCQMECAVREAARESELPWSDKSYTGRSGLTYVEVESRSGRFKISQQKVDSPGALPRASITRNNNAGRNAAITHAQGELFRGLPGSQMNLFGPKEVVQVWILRSRTGGGDSGSEPIINLGLPHEEIGEEREAHKNGQTSYHTIFKIEELRQVYLALERTENTPEPSFRVHIKEENR